EDVVPPGADALVPPVDALDLQHERSELLVWVHVVQERAEIPPAEGFVRVAHRIDVGLGHGYSSSPAAASPSARSKNSSKRCVFPSSSIVSTCASSMSIAAPLSAP